MWPVHEIGASRDVQDRPEWDLVRRPGRRRAERVEAQVWRESARTAKRVEA